MFGNKVLSDKFTVEPVDVLIQRQQSMDKLGELSELANQQQFGQVVAHVAKVGLPDDFESFEKLFEPVELAIRTAFAIPSKRPGGTRSKGTGYILPKAVKSYKSIIKGAYEYGVELLDATGMPRSSGDIREDIAAAKPVKDAEDKLMGAVEMLIKLRDASLHSDPRFVDAENRLINYLKGAGYDIETKIAEVA